MNLSSLFLNEQPIAGLEVRDTCLRLALLSTPGGKPQGAQLRAVAEENLPVGVIRQGVLHDPRSFAQSLKRLRARAGARIRYVILSLPADVVYSRVFSLPGTLDAHQLDKTVRLSVGFLLPMRLEDVYLDWERIEGNGRNEVLLATTPRVIVDAYRQAADKAGVNITAVEFHPLSLTRVLDVPDVQARLYIMPDASTTTFSIIQGRSLRFCRVVPNERLAAGKIGEEIRRLRAFYESQRGPVADVVDLSRAQILGLVAAHPLTRESSNSWLVSVGAALRGLIPRRHDVAISLMAIGTEEAHALQKAKALAGFWSSLTVGLVFLFTLAYVGTWAVTGSLARAAAKQRPLLTAAAGPSDLANLEQRAKDFNAIVRAADPILQSTPRWDVLLDDLKARLSPGITISALTITSIRDPITLAGLAVTRSDLNAFRQKLVDSDYLTDVALPLTNLELTASIPFQFTFRLTDSLRLTPGSPKNQ
ncbi:MAG: pilus assembly protein PilM [Candidatus Kerfeldbacteria bacterium]|nr:pilus assembly protein PilM [Candidatus Kerfeldbacteria bacterium]